MKTATFQLELITPCFCGGAEPEKLAEIRAPSIRGQLRWWFRTLGGFRSLAPMGVREQESLIFGSAAGEEGQAGKLIVRVISQQLRSLVKDGQELGHSNLSDPSFLTFPVQSRMRGDQKIQYNGRGVITGGLFDLRIFWKGPPQHWPDIQSLISVFGHIGSLGFRGRRAMGALAFAASPPMDIAAAREKFASPESIIIKQLPATSSKNAISVLGGWLRSCRSHGRSGQNDREKQSPFFGFAKNDHDIGYRMPGTQGKPAIRPAIGLPIIQRIQGGTNRWEWDWNRQRNRAEGRFASPVILRPHRDADGQWHALVIFVDAHQWPPGHQVQIVGQRGPEPRAVSLDLYEAMKADDRLQPFL